MAVDIFAKTDETQDVHSLLNLDENDAEDKFQKLKSPTASLFIA